MQHLPVTVHTVPCLQDNYAFIIHNSQTGQAAVVDVPEAAPILAKLAELNASLTQVVLTHHHWDHVDGLPELLDQSTSNQVAVIGATADAHRLPPLDLSVEDGDQVQIIGLDGDIMDVSGHTVGHIALHIPAISAVFTADSLMAMGCGRLFEGTPTQMWASLQRLRDLPDATTVYSGHEYMAGNAAFAQSLGEDNPALTTRLAQVKTQISQGIPTVPSTLSEEKATNPFLRADVGSMQMAIGMVGADPADVFAEIRQRKDNF